jgi:hypothetical protein
MDKNFKANTKHIVTLNILNTYNKDGCAACKHKFNLGDTVVMACGPWPDDCFRLIHENEAIFDKKTQTYFERQHYYNIKSKATH